MFDMSHKKVLITGATGGIGTQLSRTFVEQGAQVFLTGTKEHKLLEIKNSLGDRCEIFVCDFSKDDSVNSLISNIMDLGGVEVLINNAGKTLDSLFLRLTDQQWDEVLRVNLTSVMKLTRGLLKRMIKERWGRIINIASVVASTGNPGQANYVASKAGLIGMSKSLALEVASRNVTVNCIAPGFIQTNMTDKLSESQKSVIEARIPLGRIGSTAEICSSAVFLAADESSYITGQTIHVNGGLAMI